MLPIASMITEAATGAGMFAGLIAVAGFVFQVIPTLAGTDEQEVRKAAAKGGLVGFGAGWIVIVLSAGIW